MTIADNACININYATNIMRIYRIKDEYYTILITRTDIRPFSCKNKETICKHVFETVGYVPSGVDMAMIYPSTFSQKKKNKIQNLIKCKSFTSPILQAFMNLL